MQVAALAAGATESVLRAQPASSASKDSSAGTNTSSDETSFARTRPACFARRDRSASPGTSSEESDESDEEEPVKRDRVASYGHGFRGLWKSASWRSSSSARPGSSRAAGRKLRKEPQKFKRNQQDVTGSLKADRQNLRTAELEHLFRDPSFQGLPKGGAGAAPAGV
ncbi:g5370 [Coccomyxa viridis]|uniref:G5370 protein n=1 Tax=Coccomyxa viridis TaxID=1274662 RepID=A0ABP1FSN9_9CHLO